MTYTISNHISSPPSLLEISGSALGFVFKKKPPKKNQVNKRFFFYKKQVFINWFMWTQFLLTVRDWVVSKNLRLLSSLLRSDRKCSELGPPLITKVGSDPGNFLVLIKEMLWKVYLHMIWLFSNFCINNQNETKELEKQSHGGVL